MVRGFDTSPRRPRKVLAPGGRAPAESAARRKPIRLSPCHAGPLARYRTEGRLNRDAVSGSIALVGSGAYLGALGVN
jgi:hypothetical protein